MAFTPIQVKAGTAQPTSVGPTPGFKPLGTPVIPSTQAAPSKSIINPQIRDAFNSSVGEIKQGFQQSQTSSGNPIDALESGIKVTEGSIGAATSPLAPIMAPIGKGIDYVADKISNLPLVQRFAMTNAGETTARAAADVRGLSTIAGTTGSAIGGAEATPRVLSALDKDPGLMIPTPEAVASRVKTETATKLQGVVEDWKKPAAMNTPSFNKVRTVLEKSPETPQFLAEQGLNPFSHIEDGKYLTEDTAQKLRDTAGKLSRDTLRPSLQMADYTTPPTDVSSLTKPAVAKINTTFNVTAGDAQAIRDKITSEVQALQAKYPEGMSLTDLHDEGITYNKNGGYKQFKSNADNNAAIANRALGGTLKDMADTKAPKDVPVADFNSYLAKYYKAADYLDALNGKKAPVTVGQSIARGVSRFGGAALARTVAPGFGDMVSSFAGYQIGKALEHAAENITNPMRDSFLRNLQKTNPDAFNKVVQFVTQREAEAATMPRLPVGTSSNAIPLPAPIGGSSVKSVSATKNPVSVNPKTGKFQTTYSSTPK